MINRRRRLLTFGIGLAGSVAFASNARSKSFFIDQANDGETSPVKIWRGQALGADISITVDKANAQLTNQSIGPRLDHDLIKIARDLEWIESLFSLYRPDSLLTQLNKMDYLTVRH